MGANSSIPERAQAASRSAFARISNAYVVSDSEMTAKEKKKKASKFATLRKKLTRARRHSRSLDYGKSLKELLSTWSIRDISSLVHEYEALAAVKELAIAANLARPVANSLTQDLSNLYDYKFCTDVDLIYKGACFPAHRSILAIRSPFFKNILTRYPDYGCRVPIKLKTHGVDVQLFSAILRFLYTDELNTKELSTESNEILSKLAEEFGTPNPLNHDMKNLLDNGDFSDAVLVFSSDNEHGDPLGTVDTAQSMHAGSSRLTKLEIPCHKAILAARSPFFRNLIIRRARSGEELTERALRAPSRIILDETVISKRYARVLLNAIYQDCVDLSCIVRGSSSMCSLSEIQAMVASGKYHMTLCDEAMEIFQIGQFLDFPVLSQGCEDLIVESINTENLVSILSWSSEPHGSMWVHRQALHYLTEEYLQIAHSPVLFELSKNYLIEALSSDFLQAGELDVLSSILKWGEHQLIKRIEEREPNLLSHTAHSVSKKGVKKRDLNDVELREILANLLPLIRMDHVIPYSNDILNGAIKRGLVSTPPSHMLGDDIPSNRMCAWVRGRNNGIFVRPRLFTPYYDEAKAILEEQLSQAQDIDTGRVRMIHMSAIPDTLYMIEDRPFSLPYPTTPASPVDIIAGTIPVPDRSTMILMMHREQEFRKSKLAQRAYTLPCADKRMVTYNIQLRVVREFGLPDSTVEVLQNSQYYYPQNNQQKLQHQYIHQHRYTSTVPSVVHQPVSPRTPLVSPRAPLVSPRTPLVHHKPSPTSTLSPGSRSYTSLDTNEGSGESLLSEAMPDIAMPDIAMASSSLSQTHLHDELELPDIGDGSSHHGTLYI